MTWQSSLQLTFDYRPSSQKTRLCHSLHKGALIVQRPLYPEPEPEPENQVNDNKDSFQSALVEKTSNNAFHSTASKPQAGICHIYVLYPPAGIADGDELTMTFDLQPHSHAVITTPGAGKWYGQRKSLRPTSDVKDLQHNKINTPTKKHPQAEQNIHATLADEAVLEWLPQESIYFDHSVSNANNRFDLAPTASLLTWDIAVFGRQAYNEAFTHGQYNTRLQIWRDNKVLVSEHTHQQANSRWFHSPLGLNKHHVHGTFWAVPSNDVIDIKDQKNPLKLGQYLDSIIVEVRALIDDHNLPLVTTHNYQAINCRYIGTDVRACFEAFYQVRELLREKWYDLEPHRPRIWDT
ncbi:urease accessory protein UreD [Psychrobacter sp.]|uniref:urease accessory protein UreD n=1 Tax=Psychrobacter sp. TaxID=56811 RepID=UPI0025DB4A3D|nr:urease accessory protein UreD [Psychrobacter sp.]